MARRHYSVRDLVVMIDTGTVKAPLTGLSDADDAVTIEYNEDQFGDPDMDLYGGGTHVENANMSGTIVLKVKQSAKADVTLLNAIVQSRRPCPFITGSDLSTDGSSFVGAACAIGKIPSWVRGKRQGELMFAFKVIELKVNHAGQSTTI